VGAGWDQLAERRRKGMARGAAAALLGWLTGRERMGRGERRSRPSGRKRKRGFVFFFYFPFFYSKAIFKTILKIT